MRLNMSTNLKVILSALGVAALLVSPVMAKTDRHHHAGPSDVRGAVVPEGAAPGPYTSGPYTPGVPSTTHGINGDFQNGSRG
jgi:hypothetical protein